MIVGVLNYFKSLINMVYVVASNKLQVTDHKPKKIVNDRNIHDSLKFFMIFALILGILPQENILKTHDQLYFKLRSWKVVHTLVMTVMTFFSVSMCFVGWFYIGYTFTALATFVFYAGSLATLILYLWLARSWSKLIKSWCQMDRVMNKVYGYPDTLDKRLRVFSSIFLTLATADYFLSIYNRYVNMINIWEDQYDYIKFYNETFPQLYVVVPINPVTALYCSFATAHATFIWACNDLFIILISTALALRFKQITERINESYKIMKDESFWMEIREDYDRLSILCKLLDDNISYIVLLSYSVNMFFLLVQLYHSLETVSGVVGKIYFFYSFILIIVKVVSVSLYGAWINDESLEPAGLLSGVSSDLFNNEIRRLLMQISFDNVAITGFRMFKVTRGIILSIAGAIVTYELVLIQFNQATNVAM